MAASENPTSAIHSFIARWSTATVSERANSQLFLAELCDVLEVPRPDPKHDSGYAFEHVVTEHHVDGSTSSGRIDLYKRGCFVLESKQFQEAKAEATQLELAKQFLRAKPADIEEILETLASLGRAHRQGRGYTR